MFDFNDMTDAQIEDLMAAAKAELSRRKKATTATRKSVGIDLIRGAAAGTLIRVMRKGVEVVAPIAENKDKTAAFGPKGTTVSVVIEGKRCPIQGQLILGLAEAV